MKLEPLVRKVIRALQGIPEPQELQDLVVQVKLVLQALLVKQELLEPLVNKVFRV